MNKKIAIVMITMFILIIAVIAVVAYLIFNNGKDNTSYNEITTSEEISVEKTLNTVSNSSYVDLSTQKNYQEENLLYPENIEKAFEGYKGQVSIYKVEATLYKLVIDNSYRIYQATKDFGKDKIKSYYYNNYDKYKDLYIKSADDFAEIVGDFNTAFEKPNKEYGYSFVEAGTIKDVENTREYIIVIATKGGAQIKIKTTMSNTSSDFLFESYNEVEKIFAKYTGPVKEEEVQKQLSSFVEEKAEEYYEDTYKKTDNEILQLYDTDMEKLNAMGIYSKEDALAIARQTVYVRWDYKPETFMRYEIGSGEVIENGAYTKYLVRLVYSDGDEMAIELCLANSTTVTPRMKLTAAHVDETEDELDTSIEVLNN